MKTENKIKLTPNSRLRLTLSREMENDPEEKIFNESLYQKYVIMQKESLLKQMSILKSVIISDSVLLFILSGKTITIPGTNFSTKDIPAAVEVFTFFASFGFLMLSLSFLNTQFYQAIVEQFNIRKTSKSGIDPDFLTTSDIYTELYVKLFRRKLNIFGEDYFIPGSAYKVHHTIMAILIGIMVTSILIMHVIIVVYGALTALPNGYPQVALLVFSIISTVISFVIHLTPGFNFKFSEKFKREAIARHNTSTEAAPPQT